MSKDRLLMIVTLTASALLWWPLIMVIALVPHWWLPLPFIVLGSGLATALFAQRWVSFAVAAGAGTLVGIFSGYVIWPPADPESGLLVIVATPAAFILSLLANSAMRKLTLSNVKLRRAVWICMGCCFAVGPIALALVPLLVARRVAQDDLAAVKRLGALNDAARQVIAATGAPELICDGKTLQRYYSGPVFSDEDWRYITENYVDRDGYSIFAIDIDRRKPTRLAFSPRKGQHPPS